ncbi:MAG: hypothetical protein AAF489_13320 [Bacteroidota bacterium]
MNEKKIKEVIQKSKLETSSGFVDTVVQKVAARQEVKRTVVWPFGITFIGLSALMLFQSYLLYMFFGSATSVLNGQSSSLKVPIFLLFSILFLLGLNYVIRLKKAHQQMNHKTYNPDSPI